MSSCNFLKSKSHCHFTTIAFSHAKFVPYSHPLSRGSSSASGSRVSDSLRFKSSISASVKLILNFLASNAMVATQFFFVSNICKSANCYHNAKISRCSKFLGLADWIRFSNSPGKQILMLGLNWQLRAKREISERNERRAWKLEAGMLVQQSSAPLQIGSSLWLCHSQ